MTTQTINSQNYLETQAIGQRLGQTLRGGETIFLKGNLGAGKTTLTQGIAQGLGISQRITSPTFTLIKEYQNPKGTRLIHVDLYRIENDQNLRSVDLLEYLSDPKAIIVIEWAEKILTPNTFQPDIIVTLELTGEDSRQLIIDSNLKISL